MKNMNETTIQPMNGGSYFGARISASDVDSIIASVHKRLPDNFDEMHDAQQTRDNGEYHVTAVTPPETRGMSNISPGRVDVADMIAKGVGTVTDEKKGRTAVYIVVESETIDWYREGLGLPRKDLHITIGFTKGDVFGKSKDESTIFAWV